MHIRGTLPKPSECYPHTTTIPFTQGAYHVNTLAGGFGFASFRSIDGLAQPTPAAPAAGRRRRTRPVPGTLPAVTPLPAPKKRAPPPAADEPPREKKKPCFGGASVETLADIESRFLSATLPQ